MIMRQVDSQQTVTISHEGENKSLIEAKQNTHVHVYPIPCLSTYLGKYLFPTMQPFFSNRFAFTSNEIDFSPLIVLYLDVILS